MKLLLSLFILIILISCKNEKKELSEDYSAIGFVSRGNEIEVDDNLFLEIPRLHYILFQYHDSTFQVTIDKNNNHKYYYLKCKQEVIDSLVSVLNDYKGKTLTNQLEKRKKNKISHNVCGPEGYFLSNNKGDLQFCLFNYLDYERRWEHYNNHEIELRAEKFPKIYQTIYHTLNSKHLNYFMSDDYFFKEFRVMRKYKFHS